MNLLDLYEQREPYQQAIDKLEQRRIHDLNMKMADLLDRAKEPAYKRNPEALTALKKEFQKIKAERDSYFGINPATGMNDSGTLGTVKGRLDDGQVTPTATGLRHQARPGNYGGYEPEPELKGLNKTLTKNLEKGMGIEFKKGGKHNRVQVDVDETGIPGNVPTEKIPGKEDLLKGRGRTYYEDQKKSSESVDEHGGGIGPKQRWQDLMPEQYNNDEDYADEEETDLRSGDYVRDTQDGESGEVFRMQGDPYERRVRILDRDGRGWYIEPSRLVVVDRNDPDVQRYFGKQRDMDESGMSDHRAGMAKIYRQLAPKIERYRDSFLAGQLYDELENYAELHGAEKEFKHMMNGARNRAHMEYDTNPGGFENWFWFLPFADESVEEGWSDAYVSRRTGTPRTPYSVYIKGKKWKDFENDDHARAVMDKLKAKFRAEGRDPSVITIAPTDIPEGVTEDQDTSGVEQAILKRIMVAHLDLLRQYGPEKVMQAAEEVAYNVGDVDEIGTSDVSAYVNQVKQILGATP